jgi:hypothetical protein
MDMDEEVMDPKALLDKLMGRGRNGDASLEKRKNFTDDDICKDYLCGLCPYELFRNSRGDLGITSSLSFRFFC